MTMMTTADIRTHLEQRQYMPGWSFHVYDGRFEGTHLAIIAVVPDSQGPAQVTLRIENMLPPIPDPDYLDAWMVWRLSRIAAHEVREFYQDDAGVPMFDPHAPYAERDEP